MTSIDTELHARRNKTKQSRRSTLVKANFAFLQLHRGQDADPHVVVESLEQVESFRQDTLDLARDMRDADSSFDLDDEQTKFVDDVIDVLDDPRARSRLIKCDLSWRSIIIESSTNPAVAYECIDRYLDLDYLLSSSIYSRDSLPSELRRLMALQHGYTRRLQQEQPYIKSPNGRKTSDVIEPLIKVTSLVLEDVIATARQMTKFFEELVEFQESQQSLPTPSPTTVPNDTSAVPSPGSAASRSPNRRREEDEDRDQDVNYYGVEGSSPAAPILDQLSQTPVRNGKRAGSAAASSPEPPKTSKDRLPSPAEVHKSPQIPSESPSPSKQGSDQMDVEEDEQEVPATQPPLKKAPISVMNRIQKASRINAARLDSVSEFGSKEKSPTMPATTAEVRGTSIPPLHWPRSALRTVQPLRAATSASNPPAYASRTDGKTGSLSIAPAAVSPLPAAAIATEFQAKTASGPPPESAQDDSLEGFHDSNATTSTNSNDSTASAPISQPPPAQSHLSNVPTSSSGAYASALDEPASTSQPILPNSDTQSNASSKSSGEQARNLCVEQVVAKTTILVKNGDEMPIDKDGDRPSSLSTSHQSDSLEYIDDMEEYRKKLEKAEAKKLDGESSVDGEATTAGCEIQVDHNDLKEPDTAPNTEETAAIPIEDAVTREKAQLKNNRIFLPDDEELGDFDQDMSNFVNMSDGSEDEGSAPASLSASMRSLQDIDIEGEDGSEVGVEDISNMLGEGKSPSPFFD